MTEYRHTFLVRLDLDFRRFFKRSSVSLKPRRFEGSESESRERSIDHINS